MVRLDVTVVVGLVVEDVVPVEVTVVVWDDVMVVDGVVVTVVRAQLGYVPTSNSSSIRLSTATVSSHPSATTRNPSEHVTASSAVIPAVYSTRASLMSRDAPLHDDDAARTTLAGLPEKLRSWHCSCSGMPVHVSI